MYQPNRARKTVLFFSLFFVMLCALYAANAQTPGGITTGSTLWLKGNYSTTPAVKMTFSSGNLVNGWRDEKSTYNLT
jgi:hypothetical protein